MSSRRGTVSSDNLVAIAAPRTIGLLGISTGHAGQLLVSAGQSIDRLHGESSFAMLCGATPDPIVPLSEAIAARRRRPADRLARRRSKPAALAAVW